MATVTVYYNNPGTMILYPPSGSSYADEVVIQTGPNQVDDGFWNVWSTANLNWTQAGIVLGDVSSDGTGDDDQSPPNMIPEN
jgi:hypothetical protein